MLVKKIFLLQDEMQTAFHDKNAAKLRESSNLGNTSFEANQPVTNEVSKTGRASTKKIQL